MGVLEDLRFAVRLLVKDKWFTLTAVAALALGLGVNASVFTFVNAVLIRGLPFDDPDRIMALTARDPVRARDLGVSYLDFTDWTSARSFAGLAAYTGGTANLSDEGRLPERYQAAFLSANAFALLGQQPMLGRDFAPDDDRPGAASVVLLGAGVWKNRYGSDPSVVGRVVRVNDVPSVVIGVMPEGFRFPTNADLWQPLASIDDLRAQKRNARGLAAFGRLAPGVARAQAQAEMASIGARLAADHPDTNTNVQPLVRTFNEQVNGGEIRAVFLSLMGAVAFVLLVACANVANLLLSRAAVRSREVALRVSLGATRWRVVRQLLIESILLAGISGVVGLAIAQVGIQLFDAATQDVGKPYWIQFTLDGRVLAFLAAVSLGTGVIFGLAPALHVSKTDVNELLKEGGRSGTAGVRARRWTGALIVAELALTVVLLAGAGFMMRNFFALYRLDLGIDTSRLLVLRLALPERKYPSIDERRAFYRQLEDRLEANGQIEAVSIVSHVPMQGGFSRRLAIDGRPPREGEQVPLVTMVTVDRRYFGTIALPILRGRALTDEDGSPGRESAVVNERFARMHFAGEDPIGRRITLSIDLQGAAAPTGGIPTSLTATIVGIVPSVRQRGVAEPDPDPVAYLPFTTDPRAGMTLLARGRGEPGAMAPGLREEVRAIDADLPLFGILTMDQVLARQRWPFRVFGSMFALFAVIALSLSAVGLYAVTAYSVTQRTQEIGVRMALGARSRQVAWLFLKRVLTYLGVGLALGVAGALGVGRLFRATNLLVQTSEYDPVTIGSIVVLLSVVSVAACVRPARRAARLDPVAVLHRG